MRGYRTLTDHDSPEMDASTPKWVKAALALLAVAGAFACLWSAPEQPFGDELDLIRPAQEHARGVFQPRVKYPSFSLHLYGLAFRLTGVLDDLDGCLRVARVINATLFGLGILLTYAVARRLISARGALVAALLFCTLPVFVAYAPYVKTEPVLMVETLLAMYAVLRVAESPERLRWHVLAGLCAGLALATKISVFPGLMYVAWLVVNLARQQSPGWRPVAVFASVALGSMLVTWSNLWILPEMWEHWQDDPYFQPNAGPFRAVPGLTAFPWDRYTSFFAMTLPLSVGWPMMVALCWSFRLSVHRGPFGYAIGGAAAVALLMSLQATMLRVPHGFMTLFLWAIITTAVALERLRVSPARWRRVASSVLLASIVAMSVAIQFDLRKSNPEEEAGLPAMGANSMLILYAGNRQPDVETIRAQVARNAPQRLVVMSSYLLNMCKYRGHALYEDNCRYYRSLLAGETPFRHTADVPMPIPLPLLSFDPEIRDARFLVFERDDAEPSDEAPPARPDH